MDKPELGPWTGTVVHRDQIPGDKRVKEVTPLTYFGEVVGTAIIHYDDTVTVTFDESDTAKTVREIIQKNPKTFKKFSIADNQLENLDLRVGLIYRKLPRSTWNITEDSFGQINVVAIHDIIAKILLVDDETRRNPNPKEQ